MKSKTQRANTNLALKRLKLSPETIRVLGDADLRVAVGGVMDPSYRDDIGGC